MTAFALERAVAIAAAQAGARAALRYFRQAALPVQWKPDDSPVTVADRESEAAIRRLLQEAFPEDGYVGEETGTAQGGSDRRWIVDPIDGTRNFVHGIPLWAVLVACEGLRPHGERGILASCVLIPGQHECYDAAFGAGAHCNGLPIAVSPEAQLREALFVYESPSWFERNGLGAAFTALCQKTHLQRGLSDAYGHMLVASGRATLMVEPQLSLWDMAATSLVVSEAGGRFTDLNGVDGIHGAGCVVSNGLVHDETIALLQQTRGA